MRRLPGGDLLVKGVVFLLGAGLIGLGLVLSLLPGPLTLPPVLAGLFVWALEFAFAERLLRKARRQADSAWAAARAHPFRGALIIVGGLALAVTAGVLVVHPDLLAQVRDAAT